ncbi:MAG TPA: hypothetical protein V6D22_17950 [Candidatus Obscuribacterales bacterium]
MSTHIEAEHVGAFFRRSAPEVVAHLEERVGHTLSDTELETALKVTRPVDSREAVTATEAVELIDRIRNIMEHTLDDAD